MGWKDEYAADKDREFQRDLREAECNPSRRADARHFGDQLKADPELIAERVGWLLDGTYGYGAMQAAKRAYAQNGANAVEWLVRVVGAVEWKVPMSLSARALAKLTPSQKQALVAAVRAEIRAAGKEG